MGRGDHIAASLGNQDACTMTHHPTQSHYPATELTNSIIAMLNTGLGTNKYQFDKSLILTYWKLAFYRKTIRTHYLSNEDM